MDLRFLAGAFARSGTRARATTGSSRARTRARHRAAGRRVAAGFPAGIVRCADGLLGRRGAHGSRSAEREGAATPSAGGGAAGARAPAGAHARGARREEPVADPDPDTRVAE